MSTLEIILLAVITVETFGTAAFFAAARKQVKDIKNKLYAAEDQLLILQLSNMPSDADKAPKKKRYYNKKKQA